MRGAGCRLRRSPSCFLDQPGYPRILLPARPCDGPTIYQLFSGRMGSAPAAPQACRICSCRRSAIMAMNSLLVGLPLALETV